MGNTPFSSAPGYLPRRAHKLELLPLAALDQVPRNVIRIILDFPGSMVSEPRNADRLPGAKVSQRPHPRAPY